MTGSTSPSSDPATRVADESHVMAISAADPRFVRRPGGQQSITWGAMLVFSVAPVSVETMVR